MSLLGKLLSLYLFTVYGCMCLKHDDPHQAVFLAGPMTNQQVKDLNGKPSKGAASDAFDCSHPIPQGSRQYFEDLQSTGVTHFKVSLSWAKLLPTGSPSQPEQAVVACYQSLLKQLQEVGLKSLVILHGSTVPDALSSRYGGWENQKLVEKFQQYAEFAFREFGQQAHYWVTLSSLDELSGAELQNALDAHSVVYNLYHKLFPNRDGGVSVGVKASKVSTICNDQQLRYSDFISIKTQYGCTTEQKLGEQLKTVLGTCGNKPILFYEVNINECSPSKFLSDPKILKVLSNGDHNVFGLDMVHMLHPADTVPKRRLHQSVKTINSLQTSEHSKTAAFRNSYQSVWDKFAAQTPTDRDSFLNESFPANFKWAVSSESFKVEGGWKADGKGETIWDSFGHANLAYENQTADLACDSYNKVDYDVFLLRGLNVKTYQFSISWARIFPTGHLGSKSEKGALYYDKLIDALIESGIEPVATLYHWDLPQQLQDHGGWTNPSIITDFKNYAEFCFSRYGDRVKTWNTFGSPYMVSHAGHGTGEHAPSIKDYAVAAYQVTHNIIKSHAEAWHIYNDNYRKTQDGKVGIALHADWAEPLDPSKPEDIEAADRYLQFMLGWFAHPIFVDGDYPPALKNKTEQKKNDCFPSVPATLPVFTTEEKQRIRGTADFFGVNHYTSRLVNFTAGGCSPGPESVGDYEPHVDPSWPSTASTWMYLAPWGLRRVLNYISTEYLSVTKVPILITGNGMPTKYDDDPYNDTQRIEHMKNYINEALKAINLDNINVERFTVRSLMDGYEGLRGYSERFGLHYVNFNLPDRIRTPKLSAYFYSEIIEKNGFAPKKQISHAPAMTNMKYQKLAPLPPSTVPSQAKSVWEKFADQTNFDRKLFHYSTFPQDFRWGASSSAYQVEGGWDADGKGPSIWDMFVREPNVIPADGKGDVACDSYNRIEEDIYMLRGLGVNSYRFSLSWSRIFPDGRSTSINQKGVDYYNRLIDSLIANNITPMVTLYHWDLPQALQDIGGWQNEAMADIFNEYSDFCFATFGDRVKFWMTFNEPQTIAWLGYGLGKHPPRVSDPGFAPYKVAHNLIKAHAKAYHTYDDKYRASQGGLVSISLNADFVQPKDLGTPREVAAADRALQFKLGWFAHPIFKNGDYPEAMKQQVAAKSDLQGLPESRLPTFTDEEKNFIQGTADMFCLNHFTTKIASHEPKAHIPHSYHDDSEVLEEVVPWSAWTAIPDQTAVEWGMRRILNWIKEEYGDPDIYITENGAATDLAFTYDDIDRIFFFRTYVDEALKAYDVDGVKLKGYIAVSLMDSFEWLNGYIKSFGLFHVDHNNLNRPRTPKYSAHIYHQIVKNNGFPETEDEVMLYGNFPQHFNWSSASSSYQIEGAWRTDGKGLSIWDDFSHTPEKVNGGDNGDIACDSYNKIDEDMEVLKMLKVNHYRFSISWPRVLPDGTNNYINEKGLAYYERLVDALLAANIQPQVTLYHWDLPLALERNGGWTNETIVRRFRDYADVLFDRLGDRVKFWITLNEPYIVANLGYGWGTFAPGVVGKHYIAAHNLIKAHAEAWHLYNDKYRATQGGLISITVNSDWAEPRNPYKQEDRDAANRYLQFFLGWFAHPIFNGDYPEVMRTTIRERSLAGGFNESRLPEFTPEEINRIKGTHDYLGLNHYTSVLAFNYNSDLINQDYEADRHTGVISDRSWLESGSSWLRITPFGIRRLLRFLKEEYGNPPIYVTENGVSEHSSEEQDLNDYHRSYYYKNYINQALKAISFDGVDLRGYTAWSLMDNFEWASGYAERFGLFYVDFNHPNITRTPKNSVSDYATIVQCNGFPDPALGPQECMILEPEATNTPDATTPEKPGQTSSTATSTPDATTPEKPGQTSSTATSTPDATTPEKPGQTSSTATSTPFATPTSTSYFLSEVDFLGLKLTPDDAEAGLYVLFALFLLSVLVVILAVYMLMKLKHKLKKVTKEAIKLERM